ncbi:TPA: hypothetical protein JBD48_01135 [Legionella pneumophila subsp. pneumophila]|nr:hypothetical protein [Legionella pneumophila subsp. pneumophila]
MMYELKQVECLPTQKQAVKLHPEVIEILFENRRYVKNAFSNLKGLYGISHMAMTCIDPSQELIAFSTTPNIECNLIHQDLWGNDHCFIPEPEQKNRLIWWDYSCEKIEKIKLKNNQFSFGMTICRPVSNFFLMYSFATQEKGNDLRQCYNENLFGLIDMGDYFYRSLRDLYSSYALKHTPPKLSEFNSKASGLNIKPFLRVVQSINKTR